MNTQEINQMAEEVHNQNHSGSKMSNLVFNKETGEFNQVPADQPVGTGEIVTQMTDKGFAAGADPLFNLRLGFLYSRNNGILEVDILNDMRVMIVGLGSFGSQIALELAKAGVGSFALFDFDKVEVHNLARHIAFFRDLGRLKTDVVGEYIKGKNPYATVYKFEVDVNDNIELLNAEIAKADLVICTTDNNRSRFLISEALASNGKTGIFGRAYTRAEGGDVFVQRKGGACYGCLLGRGFKVDEEITNKASGRSNGAIPAYVSEDDADAVVQVGLSSDIEPICNMMTKLSLVELSRGKHSGIESLEGELTYNYYIWANRREKHFANWPAMNNSAGGPTVLRWYGSNISRIDGCAVCAEGEIKLEE